MCDCIQLGDYVCCPRDTKPQEKCIEIGNYICCPKPKNGSCSYHNSFRHGSAHTSKPCNCGRSRSEEPQRFVEEKFSNMIPPSFLCKNTDPPKPKKVRKPKVCKKVKEKVDEACAEPIHVHPAPLMPGIYMPEGMSLAPETPQVDAEGGEAAAGTETGTGKQQPETILNPNGQNFTPGSYPNVGYAPPGYPPGSAPGQAIPGYVPNGTGYMPGYPPGTAGLLAPMPGQFVVNPNLGYATNMPGYPAYGGAPLIYPPQMPAPGYLRVDESTTRQKEQAAGLPSYRQPPFDPCTGEECNRDRCLVRRSKSSAPAPHSRNGLGVGFGPQRECQPYHVEGSSKSARETNLDPPPMFNCCCHCSLSSDLIERICKSLQVSSCSCHQNCCCPTARSKMNAAKKPTVNTIPAARRKPKSSRSGTSQLGKKDGQNVDKGNDNKLAAGPTSGRTGSLTGENSGHTPVSSPTADDQEPSAGKVSTAPKGGGGGASTFSSCRCECGCKGFPPPVTIPPATRTCSCYANLMARTDDSTQTPPTEKNVDAVPPSEAPCCSIGSGATCCSSGGGGGACCTGAACGGSTGGGGTCCKAGRSSCCGNSCYWPYYYYYDSCTGLFYCYRNCYHNCCCNLNCCNSCNSCCSTLCCKSNCHNNNNNNNNKSSNQDAKKMKGNSSAANSPKRKENKTAGNGKTNQRNTGGDAMVPYRPEMQDLYEQWINFQHYLQQYYPQAAAPMLNPAPTPAPTPNPYGYYAAAISTPFYFTPSSYPTNQMNMNTGAAPAASTDASGNFYESQQRESDINWTPQ